MTLRSNISSLTKRLLPAKVRAGVDIHLRSGSALRKSGWLRSYQEKLPVDAAGNPIPWYTYPFIRFVEGRLTPEMDVFEFGSGHSTIWWSKHVGSVRACEHDKDWYEVIASRLPANVVVDVAPNDSDAYVGAAAATGRKYDIVIVDGRRRVECATRSIDALKPGGVIVWDNSDRERYEPGFAHLAAQGFTGRIDFWGMAPLSAREACTSVFYRRENCLGI
jgi:hypothetical protein